MYCLKVNPGFHWPDLPTPFLTARQLADYFLDIHNDWFETESNLMFGKKQQCIDALVFFAHNRKEIPNANHQQIYCINKFDNEFLRDFEFLAN